MKKHFFLIFPISLFLIIKVINTGVYLSDSGAYFYTAYQMLNHHLLYKDIFFADLPLFPFISMLYFLLIRGNYLVYNFIPALEAVAIAVIIYYFSYKQRRDLVLSLLSITLYLFSALILIMSGNQLGVFIASLFSILAYIFIRQKKFVIAGIFLSFSFFTKAYLFPIIGALVIASYFTYGSKAVMRLVISFFVVSTLIILPFIFLSGNELWKDVVGYSLFKSRSLPLDTLIWYFLLRDPLLIIILFISIIRMKKDLFTGFLSIGYILFFIFYQGLKPLYLIIIFPFLCLYIPDLCFVLTKKMNIQRMVIPTFLMLYIFFTCYKGIVDMKTGRIPDINGMVSRIVKEKPNFIYGTSIISTIASYMSGVPLLRGQIDTSDGLFSRGLLDKHTLTKEAIDNKALILAMGYQDINTGEMIIGNPTMFDLELLKSPKCSLIDHYLMEGDNAVNQILLIKCY